MRNFSRGLGFILLVAGIGGAPGTALAQSAGQVRQQERLVNVLLAQNQLRINHEDNAIAQQNVLLSELPGASPARQARLIARIDVLNNNLASAEGRLESGLDQTATALGNLATETPSNPFVASGLAAYLQRADLIFSTELQEAEAIINRPPATASSFGTGVDPLGIARTSTISHASAAVPTVAAPAAERLTPASVERAEARAAELKAARARAAARGRR